MRLAKGIAATACFLVGLWLMLRAAGLLTAILQSVPRWWPTLPLAAGAAILVRSRRLGPHTAVSLVLIAASSLALAIIHHRIAVTAWPFGASAGLMAVGLSLAYVAIRSSSRPRDNRTQRIVLAFRSARLPAASADLVRIRVYAFCGRLDLDLRDRLVPGSLRDPLMIEIMACLANVTLVAHPDVLIYRHEAFVMRFAHPVRGEVLSDEDAYNAAAVVATLAFFGGVNLRAKYPAVAVPGN
ncbi:MAG TPA: hypothetical protein VH589_30095 [Trebonia sp.]|jgi:hypothetical protein